MRKRARAAMWEYEGRRWSAIPWRVRLAYWATHPIRFAHIFSEWHRQVTCLPGDKFAQGWADRYLIVREVKSRHVKCEVVSGEYVARSGFDWRDGLSILDDLPTDRTPDLRTFERTPLGFWA